MMSNKLHGGKKNTNTALTSAVCALVLSSKCKLFCTLKTVTLDFELSQFELVELDSFVYDFN